MQTTGSMKDHGLLKNIGQPKCNTHQYEDESDQNKLE
jgi:hypothetical protein